MASKNTKSVRAHRSFDNFLDDIRVERMKRGKDKKPLSNPRLTLGMTRVDGLKDFMVNSEFRRKNEK